MKGLIRVGWHWAISPLMGVLIGWSTNRLAIRMLFRPRQPRRILGVTFQGLLPRRHLEMARVIGETVERDLMSADTIVDIIRQGEYDKKAVEAVKLHVAHRLERIWPPFTPEPLRTKITRLVQDLVAHEAEGMITRLEEDIGNKLRDDLSIADIVEQRIAAFDLNELERLVTNVASPELRYIEVLGGVLGGLIGVVQAALVSFV